MHVGVDREARRVMTEPVLHLYRVPAAREQPRGNGMPEGMHPRPLHARLRARGSEDPFTKVVRIERRSCPGDEHEISICLVPDMRLELVGELDWDRNVTSGVSGLQRPHHKPALSLPS